MKIKKCLWENPRFSAAPVGYNRFSIDCVFGEYDLFKHLQLVYNQFTAERNQFTAEGTQFTAEGNQFTAEGNQFTAEGNQFTAEGNQFTDEGN